VVAVGEVVDLLEAESEIVVVVVVVIVID